jgi:peptidoglycan/xylan/chitin deacetylase (PgdA/CDA1 family)
LFAQLLSAAAASATGLVTYGTFAPRSQLWGPVVCRGDRGGLPRVALTFDDGPHPEATPRILDQLTHAGARATFFLVGMHAQQWPHLVRRIHDEGHLIGNHSFAHAVSGSFRLTGYWEDSIVRTGRILEDIIGARPIWFRPPFAVKQWHLSRAVQRTRQTMITFSRRGLDGRATTAGRIVARLVPHATPGDILALHDGVVRGMPRPIEPTLEALPVVLSGLRDRGLAIAPLSEILPDPPYLAAPAPAAP